MESLILFLQNSLNINHQKYILQEYGDSARARKQFGGEESDDEEMDARPNPRLSAGKY